MVHQTLDGKVADGVDEGQEGAHVERLAAEVEGPQEAERAGVHTATTVAGNVVCFLVSETSFPYREHGYIFILSQ